MDKGQIISALIAALEQQLGVLGASAKSAREGAISEESRAENEYDTRALEAGYLAGAQAARAEAIKGELAALRQLHLRPFKKTDPIELAALVELEDEDGKKALYFLGPSRGMTVKVGGKSVQAITAASPLGRELLGKKTGDEVEVEVRGDARAYTIVSVR